MKAIYRKPGQLNHSDSSIVHHKNNAGPADKHALGIWIREHVAGPVAHHAHQIGRSVRQTARLFGNRQATAGQAAQPQSAALSQNTPLQPVPFLRVGDPAIRMQPPRLYQGQWVRGQPPVYNEIPVIYVQNIPQPPVLSSVSSQHDDLITYF
ncbi:hypothetical protein ACSFA3_19495 [Variovorax sp. RHLX14]|uniref:hypothetical protein n=1 Tax=Variovorax sp. RHLX14 TaxID=1259731 RepID=UPI003F485BE9